MSQGNELLRAILMNPKCDTTRLVYADWLQDNGDPDRAEFIRIQVGFSQGLYKGKPLTEMPDKVVNHLASTEYKFVERMANDWFLLKELSGRKHNIYQKQFFIEDFFRPRISLRAPRLPRWSSRDGDIKLMITNGFVTEISLPLNSFLTNANALFQSQPIENVKIIDVEPDYLGYGWCFWNEPAGASASSIPDDLWCEITGPRDMRWVDTTSFESHKRLGLNCVAYGRKQAGLM